MIRTVLALSALGMASACSAQPARTPANDAAEMSSAGAAQPITLMTDDGVKVFGTYYPAAHPRALILLFHQAGSSAGEYATIAPRLVAAGYSALAIDQRSGGSLFGANRTAAAAKNVPEGDASYLAAKPDLQAALDWAATKHLPVAIWGSSYSSSLVFLIAAENPGKVKALLSFSPGEYLGGDHLVRDAATKVAVPVYVTATASERAGAEPIYNAVRANAASRFVIPPHAVHGSSTLIVARNPEGAAANWPAVMAFLKSVLG